MSEKTTSEFMLEIASHYLMNGCDDCPFYNVTKTCDSKPINCTWMALRNYFKAEESKEELPSTEQECKKGKWQRRKGSDCWECSQCHAVLESDDIVRHNFYYCYHCGADMMNEDGYMKLEGTEHE